MQSPEQQWWIEDERKRIGRSQHWQPLLGALAVLAIAAVAIWALVTM